MNPKPKLDLDSKNRDAYDDLIVSIEAKEAALSILIAVCDDLYLREEIIAEYELELQSSFRSFRVTLSRGEPSLTAAISQLLEKEEYLRQGGKAIITVTGIEQLYFLRLDGDRSEREIFLGYLQWTREALRQFSHPIILWVTNQILIDLIKKAPDFWSWRDGVFRFASQSEKLVISNNYYISSIYVNSANEELFDYELADCESSDWDEEDIDMMDELLDWDEENPYFLPIEDLEKLIQQKEQQQEKDTSLATLYSRLGEVYLRRLNIGESQDDRAEQNLAIDYLSKAIELNKKLGLNRDLANNLNNLALVYSSQGRYAEAERLHLQA
jgi:tetratricopeptide (TPR) repeat protein